MGSDDLSDLSIELVAVDHEDIAAAQTLDLNVGSDPDDLESLAMGGTRMRTLHLDFVIESVVD